MVSQPPHGDGATDALPAARLGGREASKTRPASQGGRVPGDDDRAPAGADHGGREAARQIEQAHRIDLEIAVKHRWIDFEEGAEGASDGVVHHHIWRAELALDAICRAIDLRRVRNVAGIALASGNFALEP